MDLELHTSDPDSMRTLFRCAGGRTSGRAGGRRGRGRETARDGRQDRPGGERISVPGPSVLGAGLIAVLRATGKEFAHRTTVAFTGLRRLASRHQERVALTHSQEPCGK